MLSNSEIGKKQHMTLQMQMDKDSRCVGMSHSQKTDAIREYSQTNTRQTE